eukprot:363506-Chlamydomonas_euryale.AAC.8
MREIPTDACTPASPPHDVVFKPETPLPYLMAQKNLDADIRMMFLLPVGSLSRRVKQLVTRGVHSQCKSRRFLLCLEPRPRLLDTTLARHHLMTLTLSCTALVYPSRRARACIQTAQTAQTARRAVFATTRTRGLNNRGGRARRSGRAARKARLLTDPGHPIACQRLCFSGLSRTPRPPWPRLARTFHTLPWWPPLPPTLQRRTP